MQFDGEVCDFVLKLKPDCSVMVTADLRTDRRIQSSSCSRGEAMIGVINHILASQINAIAVSENAQLATLLSTFFVLEGVGNMSRLLRYSHKVIKYRQGKMKMLLKQIATFISY